MNVAGDAVSVQVPSKTQTAEVVEDSKVAHFEVQDSYGP